jgi:Arc/MetJ-type ribon-helix-helix transcriptional regulator
MEVVLTTDQEAFIREAVSAGRVSSAEEAITKALALWEEHERSRAEILAAVDMAESSIARGQGRVITQNSMAEFADETKTRGRARLASDRRAQG